MMVCVQRSSQQIPVANLPDTTCCAVSITPPASLLQPAREIIASTILECLPYFPFPAISNGQMSQLRKKPFGGFLSRTSTGSDRSIPSSSNLVRTDTDSSLSLSSLQISDDEKGPLGLTTLHECLPATGIAPSTEIIFIHGLGGGSRKSWSYSSDPKHYWPLAWLPTDDDFADVRIHTFGYKADWGERRQSILNIHAFAQSLLGALRNHPGIRRSGTRIILVCHSMGGCVAKMAYILARQDPTASELASRFHSIFFLGTPHRGSEMAAVLENMLTVAWGKKPFVTDLMPNSEALTNINDTFRHFSPALRLWSFYETLPVRAAGIMSRLVVERHSATLGYHNEEIAAMDADHRHLCKFDSPEDPNYKLLRNALLTAVDLVRADTRTESFEIAESPVQMPTAASMMIHSLSPAEVTSRLRGLLGAHDSLESDLTTLQLLKQPGSCQWFIEKDLYVSWKAGGAPGILWLIGRPAAGKSVLASHIIEDLKSSGIYCSYFIFKHAKSGNATLGHCFQSLAYQMGMHDALVREALLQLSQDGLVWDRADDASIWRRLFTSTIFQLPSISRHVWVLDGIDECGKFGSLFTKKFLASIPDGLRLFATSRGLEEIERGLASLGTARAKLHALSDTDTEQDMRLFLNTRLKELGRFDGESRLNSMCERILHKSTGSFLWARLVLQEFENMWTEEAMDSVLQEVPPDLQQLYSRMADSIELDKRKLPLAKSILTWVVLASRPLKVEELRCAVKIDTNQTLQNVARAIPDLCGQLVYVDHNDNVHMIHETAREFLLLTEPPRDLAVMKKEGHSHLASLLLGYLSSEVTKPPQARPKQTGGRFKGFAKQSSAQSTTTADDALVNYASEFFSEHVYKGTSEDESLMGHLCTFFSSMAVLSWIEHVAKAGDLSPVTRAAMNIREYLTRRMKYVPPTHPSVKVLDSWVIDLIRVTAKFRTQLLGCPSSIHCLVPSLCPSKSIIAVTFAKDTRPSPVSSGLVVRGTMPSNWDDCLVRLDFQKGRITTVSHGDSIFAVGLSTGQISIYDSSSLQRLRRITHPERVRMLLFDEDDRRLVSCGAKRLLIWNPKSGIMTHSFFLQSIPLALSFLVEDELLCAFQSSELTKWSLATEEQDTISWKEVANTDPSIQSMIPSQPPSKVAFLDTGDGMIMAVGYRAHPILLWNALDLDMLGFCEHTGENNGIDCMAFNPNPDIPVLVVSYQDGCLCVFDYITMQLQLSWPNMFSYSIACSPDGRSLATGSNQGVIEVFDFERDHAGVTSLIAIYRTSHPLDDMICGLAFSADGLRFVDTRGQQARVWAPASLVRKRTSESGSSIVESAPGNSESLLAPRPTGMLDRLQESEITTPLLVTSDGSCILAGKSNGEVALFSEADPERYVSLYRHARGASIVSIVLAESRNAVLSADDSGRVLMVQFASPLSSLSGQGKAGDVTSCLDRRFGGGAVIRLMVNTAVDRVLVGGRYMDELWDIPSGSLLFTREYLAVPRPPHEKHSDAVDSKSTSSTALFHSSFQHPSSSDWFVIFMDDLARIYSWADFSELTPPAGLQLARHFGNQIPIWEDATATYLVGVGFVLELLKVSNCSCPHFNVWPASELNPQITTTSPAIPATEPHLAAIGPVIEDVIGMTGPSTLVFLDTNLWVCTVELESVGSRPVIGSSLPSSRRSSAWSISPAATPRAHAKRHFFALSEWRTTGPGEKPRCCLAGTSAPSGRAAHTNRDVVFAVGDRLIIIKGGFEFSESVNVAALEAFTSSHGGDLPNLPRFSSSYTEQTQDETTTTTKSTDPTHRPHNDVWTVVAGSMHRRASNW
ncbi:hypothetical protein V8F20_008670 [Naviculisporaceae sp. PSN 640]